MELTVGGGSCIKSLDVQLAKTLDIDRTLGRTGSDTSQIRYALHVTPFLVLEVNAGLPKQRYIHLLLIIYHYSRTLTLMTRFTPSSSKGTASQYLAYACTSTQVSDYSCQ